MQLHTEFRRTLPAYGCNHSHHEIPRGAVYISLPNILTTGSYDFLCRLWTLSGRYLGTLGTPLPWRRLSPFDCVDESQYQRMPPDIKKVASSTTMKVISGVQEDSIKLQWDVKNDRESGVGRDEGATGGFLISFQPQYGTLDIEMQERPCGKGDSEPCGEDAARIQLLEIELPSPQTDAAALLNGGAAAADEEPDECL